MYLFQVGNNALKKLFRANNNDVIYVALVFLLLSLNIFDTFFTPIIDFEQINAWRFSGRESESVTLFSWTKMADVCRTAWNSPMKFWPY